MTTALRYRRILALYRETSRDAWASVWQQLPYVDRHILGIIEAHDGATGDEIEQYASLKHQTVSAQIRHMVEAGLLQDSGARRKNQNGRPCIVWTLAPHRVTVPDAAQPSLFA